MKSRTMADCTLNTHRVLTDLDLVTPGVSSLAVIGSSPNANAATISGTVLNFQPASSSFGGVVTTGTQSFAGNKTFTGTIGASNLSGANSGDVTLTSIGATPNANGASLSGQALNFQPASASFGGVVTTGTQSFAGIKTLVNDTNFSSNILLPTTTPTAGIIYQNSHPFIHSSGQPSNLFVGKDSGNLTVSGADGTNTGVGVETLLPLTTGVENTALGGYAGNNITTGRDNTLVGYSAGIEFDTQSYNIFMGSNPGSQLGPVNNTLYFGNHDVTLQKAYIEGIGGVVPSGSLQLVTINPTTFQLGSSIFVNETLYSAQTFTLGTFITSATVPAALPVAAFTQSSVGGLTRVAPGTIHVTKKGSYEFYVQISLNIESILYVQMKIDAVAYDANSLYVGGLTGLDRAGMARFTWNQTADAAHDITFFVAADSRPTPATTPNILTVNVITTFISYPI